MAEVPTEYHGREQSYLKHLFLAGYLEQWAHKLGSVARSGRRTRLWYVDAFAGPWNQRHPEMRDTSIAIGLDALEKAAATWRGRGYEVELGAIFVEREEKAFRQLEDYLRGRATEVQLHPFQGEFGAFVDTIKQLLERDAAFIFVDPKGWKGAGMRFIAPLVTGPAPRDVLVNVMYDHMNRQKDRLVSCIREQMRDFFGLRGEDLPQGLTEEELLGRYRAQLKLKCGLTHAAELAVPHPVADRNKFHLVVGGKDKAVLQVFRDIEKEILGKAAAVVRDEASRRHETSKTGQTWLFALPPPSDRAYEALHQRDVARAERDVETLLQQGARRFVDVWPKVLEERHLSVRDLSDLVLHMHKDGQLVAANLRPRERSIKDDHVLHLSRPTLRQVRSGQPLGQHADAEADASERS